MCFHWVCLFSLHKWLSHPALVYSLSDSSLQHGGEQVLIVSRISAAQYSHRGAAFCGVIALPHTLPVRFRNKYKILVFTLSIFSLLLRRRASFTEAGRPLISVPLPLPPWAYLIPSSTPWRHCCHHSATVRWNHKPTSPGSIFICSPQTHTWGGGRKHRVHQCWFPLKELSGRSLCVLKGMIWQLQSRETKKQGTVSFMHMS